MRTLTVSLALVTLALLLPLAAQAHPVQECGDYGGGSDFGTVDGAGAFNVTTRLVTCETALRIVKRFYFGRVRTRCNGRGACRSRIGTFRCRSRQTGYESADTRCTSSRSRHYAVRFQFAA